MSGPVVILDHTAELGGAELALVRLLAAMDDDVRANVLVILLADGPLVARLERVGVAVEVHPLTEEVRSVGREKALKPTVLAKSAAGAGAVAWRVARRLRALDAAVLHTTSLKADLIGAVASPLARVPLVWHVHDRIADDYLPARSVTVLRALARRVPAAVIVNSQAVAATLPGVRALHVVYPGLAPQQVRETPRRTPAEPTITIVGRLSPTKGQLEMVQALPAVRSVVPAARLRLVGAASFGHEPYAERVRTEAERLGVSGAVEHVGFVDDPAQEWERASVLVHVAQTPEPFGQVVAEAMAYGVPVVTTGRGGTAEIVCPGPDALAVIVDPSDSAALRAAIVGILTSPDAAEALAGRAHESVGERFAVADSARAVASIWRCVSFTKDRH